MKIRLDFVTNSSSSSFVVGFDRVPESIEDLQKILFGDEMLLKGYKTSEIARSVWLEMGEPMNLLEAYAEADDCYVDIDYHGVSLTALLEVLKKFNISDDEIAEKLDTIVEMPYDWKSFKEKFSGKKIYEFEFSDDTDYSYVLEQGGIFDKLPHATYSHH